MKYKQTSPLWIKVLFAVLIATISYFEISDGAYFGTSWPYFLILLAYTAFVFVRYVEVLLDPKGVRYRVFPFQLELITIPSDKIKSISVQTIQPITMFGGWGVRTAFGGSGSKLISLKGKVCLRVYTTDNEEIFLGLQDRENLDELRSYLKN